MASKTKSTDRAKPEKVNFSVSSALLRELGERLVGQPHIALAELIKNSFDADATNVQITVRRNQIVIEDNGHGMDFKEFKDFWMRIGTPHKRGAHTSRNLHRVMTGSKGVGRLAVQFLARKVDLYTVSNKKNTEQLHAKVNWDEAVEAGELTEAEATVWRETPSLKFPGQERHGTRVVLSNLEQDWSPVDFKKLAREIWFLQPPVRKVTFGTEADRTANFSVELDAGDPEAITEFNNQMSAFLNIWHAKLNGRLVVSDNGGKYTLDTRLEFSDGETHRLNHSVENSSLRNLDYEIRIYHFSHRQRFGILVDTARNYMESFGGVHIYDGGFNLPYFGADTDWLDIEKDHARRKSVSKLLPDEIHIPGAMTFLPTNRRIFGVVNVSTALEASVADRPRKNVLQIQVSRDRLVDNEAYGELKNLVRLGLDFYAVHEKGRNLDEHANLWDAVEPVPRKVRRVEQVLQSYEETIPKGVFEELSFEVAAAVEASETEAEQTTKKLALVGTLATAGITSLATEHQVGHQLTILEKHIERLKTLGTSGHDPTSELGQIAEELEEWLRRVRATRQLFTSFMDEESRTKKRALRVDAVMETIRDQVKPLMRSIDIDTSGLPSDVRLPSATLAEWSAIFQNVLINSLNATIDSEEKRVRVTLSESPRKYKLLVEDSGAGIDLEHAEDLFKPFERELEISEERRQLGLGGTGMGLTIVRMLADNIGCDTRFVPPSAGFGTAFELSWEK